MKRYTAPFQKLQLLMVYSSISTLIGACVLVKSIQAWIAGSGWLEVTGLIVLMVFPVRAVLTTYRDLRALSQGEPTDVERALHLSFKAGYEQGFSDRDHHSDRNANESHAFWLSTDEAKAVVAQMKGE